MEAMAEMPDKAYDLAIVDPPYGIDIETHQEQMSGRKITINGGTWKQYRNTGWDKEIPCSEYFQELFRVSKNQIIWGGNFMLDHLGKTKAFRIWDKVQRDNRADCEIAWASFDKPSRIFSYSRADAYINDCDMKIHPTQKPVKLYEWLLKLDAKPGDRILDTHGGSCSIAIACYNLDFDLTCFEIDAEYHGKAVQRLEEHRKQGRLFEAVGCSPAKI